MQERVNKLLSTTCMVERQSGPEPTYGHVDRFGGKFKEKVTDQIFVQQPCHYIYHALN